MTKKRIQEYIDYVRDSLSVEYFNLERDCSRDTPVGGVYRELFSRSTVEIPISLLESEYLGDVEKYEYYQDVLFYDKFVVLNGIKVRINKNWEFRYLIEDSREKLPFPISQMIKQKIT